MHPPAPDSDLALIGGALRAAFVREPEPDVAEAHLAAILAEAERVAAAGASALVASAGLAIAGVRPPEPFSDLFEGVGFNVPGEDDSNSEDDGDAATPVREREPAGTGRAPAHDDTPSATQPGSAADDRSHGDEHRSDRGEKASGPGRETAEQAQDGNTPPTGPGRSDEHPTPPASPPAQSQSGAAGPPDHSQAGGDPFKSQAGRGGPPHEPPAEPPADPQADAPGAVRGPSATELEPPGNGDRAAAEAGRPR